jgi:cysteine-rich repeat protein
MRLTTKSVFYVGLLPLMLACGEPAEPFCGDGTKDANEQCDDGNNADGDECRADCTIPECGDGRQDAGEECDDGDNIDGDGCESDCTLPFCGNDITDSNEECDDGNNQSGDGCTATCDAEVCGDGIDNNGNAEQCDDGNAVNTDACRNNCQLPDCGDGVLDAGEACDDTNTTNGDGCDENCTVTGCGNGISTIEFCFQQDSFDAGVSLASVSFGDIDQDGDADLAAVDNDNNVIVFKNDGAGKFVAPLALLPGDGVNSVVFGDLDGDQDEDMIALLAVQFSTTYVLLKNDGTGLFGAPIFLTSQGFSGLPLLNDIDNDNDVDLLIPGLGVTAVARNDGSGAFPVIDIIAEGAIDSLISFDADNDQDLLLNRLIGGGDVNIGRNNGGQFAIEPLFNKGLTDIVAVDMNADGDLDLVGFTNFTPDVTVFQNDAGVFTAQPSFSSAPFVSGAAIDVNNDSFGDVVALNISQNRQLSFMFSDGLNLSTPLDIFSLSATSGTLNVQDINGDGLSDMIVGDQATGALRLFLSNP